MLLILILLPVVLLWIVQAAIGCWRAERRYWRRWHLNRRMTIAI